MKKIFLTLIMISQMSFAGNIPGLYQCKILLAEQYRNGSISKKRVTFKSLYLNISREKINIYGIDSGRSICTDLEIDQIYRDTIFIIPRIEKNGRNRARLYIKGDTITGDYNFLDNSSYDSIAVKIVISRAPNSVLERLKRQCK